MTPQLDQLKTDFRELVTGEVALVSAAVATLAGLLGVLDPLIALVTSTAGTWFPLTATLSAVAPLVPAIPTDLATQAFIVAAFVYIAVLLDRFAERAVEVLKDS